MEENTYGSLSTEAYDIIYAEPPPDALEFFLRHLESADEPVLEPMCGSGRFLIPFLEHGIDIDGVDVSRHMLRKCFQRCVSRYDLLEEGRAPRTEVETIELRLYERHDFHRLLEAANFSQIMVCRAYDDNEPDGEDSTIIFECIRAE